MFHVTSFGEKEGRCCERKRAERDYVNDIQVGELFKDIWGIDRMQNVIKLIPLLKF